MCIRRFRSYLLCGLSFLFLGSLSAPMVGLAQDSSQTSATSGAGSDTDGDGSPDESDNCPLLYNADQSNADGDILGDVCEYCGDVDFDGALSSVDVTLYIEHLLDPTGTPLTPEQRDRCSLIGAYGDCSIKQVAVILRELAGLSHPPARSCVRFDAGTDNDLDGVSEVAGDCNDRAPTAYPGAPERCDGLDNDCDGMLDEGPDLACGSLRDFPIASRAQEPVQDEVDARAAAILGDLAGFGPATGRPRALASPALGGIEGAPGSTKVLSSGENRLDRIDLEIPGRGEVHFQLSRRYRSQLDYNGPIGFGWDFSYNDGLFVQPNGDVIRSNGAGHLDTWVQNADGTFRSPAGHFSTLLARSDGRYVLRSPDGYKRIYRSDGRLDRHVDRFGNTLALIYDASGRLAQIVDVFGREIEFEFAASPDGRERLAVVRDFAGREVLYNYDAEGNLESVRSPVVVGTSTGNDFPSGRTERYAYSSGFPDSELNHNLEAVWFPEQVENGGSPALSWEYGTNLGPPMELDRVVRETLGGTNATGVPAGGDFLFEYLAMNEQAALGAPELSRLRVSVTTRNGNRTVTSINEHGHMIHRSHETRGLRAGEPGSYDSDFVYNADGLLVRQSFPLGNEIRFAYESRSRASEQNIAEVRRIPDAARGGDELVTTFTYEPVYNQLASVTDPRGNAPSFTPPLGQVDAGRYTQLFVFDYQEGTGSIPDATEFDIDLTGIERDLGDLNGNGRADQVAGSPVQLNQPAVRLRADSEVARRLGTTRQSITTQLSWNDRGQLTALVDPEGNLHLRDYYPEGDPDGDGTNVAGRSETDPSGYPRSQTTDAGFTPRRTSTEPASAIRTELFYDVVGNLTAVRNGRGVESVYEINALNQLVASTRGAAVSQAAATGELITGESPFGYRTQWIYDRNGRVIRHEVENRDLTTPGVGSFVDRIYRYDLLGNPIEVQQEIDGTRSAITQFRYDPSELLVQITKPEGNRDAFTYDERNLPFLVSHGEGSAEVAVYRSDYDLNGNRVRLHDAEDNDGDGVTEIWTRLLDGHDRIVRTSDPLGNHSSLSYDPASNVVRVERFGHPANNPTAPPVRLAGQALGHDELNRVFRVDTDLFLASGFNPTRSPSLMDGDGDGVVTSFVEFDALSRKTFWVEDDGEQTQTMYDGANRAIARIDAAGNRHEIEYDSNSNPIEFRFIETATIPAIADQEFLVSYVWDQLDRLVRISADQTTRLTYDSHDNVIAISDPEGPEIQDPLGLFPGVANAPGNTKTLAYDGRNLLTQVVADLREFGSGGEPIDTSNPFNPGGQIALSMAHDGNSRLTSRTDDKGNTTSVVYDALDRVIREINDDATEFGFTYDRDSNLVSAMDPNGTTVVNTFDPLNRIVHRAVLPGAGVLGTQDEIFGYDGLSRLTWGADLTPGAMHEVWRTYDSRSLLLEERLDGDAWSSVWSGDGRQLSTVYPSGRTLDFGHDNIDRVQTIQDSTEVIADYSWIGPGYERPLDRRHGNGTRLTFLNDAGNQVDGYDVHSRKERMRHMKGSDTLVERSYTYNRANHRTSQTRVDQGGERDFFTYDSAYRLERYEEGIFGPASDRTDVQYTLDGVGSRVEEVRQDGTNLQSLISYTPNQMNEYERIGGTLRSHDANGNLINDGSLSYFYDYKNRLVAVRRQSDQALIAEYEYDPFGRRVLKRVYDPATQLVQRETQFRYDADFRVVEEFGSGGLEASYVHGVGIDEPVQMRKTAATPGGSGTFYLHQDVRGDVVAVTDASGSVLDHTSYADYGSKSAPSSAGNPYGFQGRRFDPETGLYYFRNRYLDPRTGRFLQRDRLNDPMNAGNRYTFVGNGPASRIDPFGLSGEGGGSGNAPGKSSAAAPTQPSSEPIVEDLMLDVMWETFETMGEQFGHTLLQAADMIRADNGKQLLNQLDVMRGGYFNWHPAWDQTVFRQQQNMIDEVFKAQDDWVKKMAPRIKWASRIGTGLKFGIPVIGVGNGLHRAYTAKDSAESCRGMIEATCQALPGWYGFAASTGNAIGEAIEKVDTGVETADGGRTVHDHLAAGFQEYFEEGFVDTFVGGWKMIGRELFGSRPRPRQTVPANPNE